MKKIGSLLLFLLTTNALASYVSAPYPTSKGGTGSASQTASRAVTTDGSGNVVSSSSTTSSEIGFVHGVTSAIQTQLGTKIDALGAVGASANANAASISGTTLNLQPFSSSFPGVVPASGGGTSNFLRADGVWSAAGTGTVSSVALTVPSFLSVSGSPVTTSGTLAVTLSGTALPIANGGTGQTTAAAAFNALSPMTTTGDLEYESGTGVASRLGIGSTNQVLTVVGGIPAWAAAQTPLVSVVNGGDAAYSILSSDAHIRSSTTLTASRTYTLDTCTSGKIGERHTIKNLPAQTFTIVVAANGSDLIDGAANYTLNPGDGVSVICSAFSSVGTWDIE